ncbi:hypothetical protein [Alkalihalobacillus pseudalcaliphilus]|uniref:hypothetical protein n=1 Tax=Alkalihalobacillus pseudalcaliphilus TaxID=79884 RepID=UPI00064D917A|nr:hypothetical protein [Alkalihalobacillus pseudalcaliphilus]KMK77665.1 hypothetical protein AB990_04195 [Alkalihalobacillus pseudalcaliphilus]
MDVIPFVNTWPYEKQMKDIYFHTCPFCQESNVLTNLKIKDLEKAQQAIKVRLIVPCCHEVITILEADEDYLWTDQKLRK